MNFTFGAILLKDMDTFMNKVNGVQGHALERSRSTGSGTLARDSDDGHSVKSTGDHPVPHWVP